MPTDTTYNGWANYETWNAALWLDNEPAYQEWAREWVRANRRRVSWHGFAEYLADTLRELFPDAPECFTPATGDGVPWDDPRIDAAEMVAYLRELAGLDDDDA